MEISKGRYWDKGIELVSGCTPCSPGCYHCWSAAMTHRFKKYDSKNRYLTDWGGKFNGYIQTNPDRLDVFRKTQKQTVFAIWNDLFHEKVSIDFINQVFAVINSRNRHIYLILTKRPNRMLQSLQQWNTKIQDNVYFGLTVCNQEEADEKIPIFLQVPGKKYLSFEPLLGPVDLEKAIPIMLTETDISVILGGETGHGSRPLHPDWVRGVRNQCVSAGVPFFFKQWGEWSSYIIEAHKYKRELVPRGNGEHFAMWKVGCNKAGRILDVQTHDELPWVKI